MYFLGQIRGNIIPFNSESMKKYFHGKVSGEYLKERRYKESGELYEEALAFAENSWEEGDKLLHHKMVQEIRKMDGFKKLTKERLLKEIKPIAEKYGRFWNPNASKKE
jgi:hypothetical protein